MVDAGHIAKSQTSFWLSSPCYSVGGFRYGIECQKVCRMSIAGGLLKELEQTSIKSDLD